MKRLLVPVLIAAVLTTGLFGFLMMAHAPHGPFQMGACVVATLNGGGCAITGSAASIDFHVRLFKSFAALLGAALFAVAIAFIAPRVSFDVRATGIGPPLRRLIVRSKFRQTRWRRRVAKWLAIHELRDSKASA